MKLNFYGSEIAVKGMHRWVVSLLLALISTIAWAQQTARLQLIPPSPVTNRVVLDIRGAVENNADSDQQFSLSLCLSCGLCPRPRAFIPTEVDVRLGFASARFASFNALATAMLRLWPSIAGS